jgi:translation initiation factor IF-3
MTNYRRRRRPKKDTKPKFRVNEYIPDQDIRIIGPDGNFLGIMTTQEGLKLAEEKELDLIEINPKANPAVVKMVDYNKFKYEQSKSGADKQKNEEKIKTIRVSVRIGPHDLAFQARKCDQFLEKGFKVKLQVQMRGREKAHPEVAEEVLFQFLNMIEKEFAYVQEPKKISDSYFATVQPKSS